MNQATPVILYAGSGTCLRPLSRTCVPKQILCLTGNESLFQLAAKRLNSLVSACIQVALPLIVTADEGSRFMAKRIQVKPKANLSLQKHLHLSEHWVVVSGITEITNADKVLLLTENLSTYIPLGEVHRLTSPGSIPQEIIEVQSGRYSGEDDFVRFEDTYGRDRF